MLDQHAADDPAVRPFEDFDDYPLAAPTAVHPDDAYEHAIAMQDLRHLPSLEKQILTTIIGDQEAVAIGMSLDAPGDQTGALGQDVRALAVAQQLCLAFHRPQATLERIDFGILDVKERAQRFETHRLALLRQDLQQVFARG